MSFSKPQVSLSSNFAWLFSVMKYNSTVLFLGQTLYTSHKRDQSKFKFFSARISVNFNASSGKSENLHFDMLILSIAHKASVKKVQKNKNYLSWHWKKIQTLKENWLFIWKMTWEIWWALTWAVESLKICILMGYFCRKYVMLELKRYRGVLLWKMTCAFKNDISNLVNFHTSSWK